MDDFDFFRLYKTLHVLMVIVLGGGVAIETVIGPLMVRASSIQELRAYTRLSRISENFIILPAALFLIGFGYATAGRAGYDLDTTWLLLGQVLTYAAVGIAFFYLRSVAIRLDSLAKQAPEGPVPPELQRELKNPLPALLGALLTIVFVAIVYLMVARPAW